MRNVDTVCPAMGSHPAQSVPCLVSAVPWDTGSKPFTTLCRISRTGHGWMGGIDPVPIECNSYRAP